MNLLQDMKKEMKLDSVKVGKKFKCPKCKKTSTGFINIEFTKNKTVNGKYCVNCYQEKIKGLVKLEEVEYGRKD